MPPPINKLPKGNFPEEAVIRSATDLGRLASAQRKRLKLIQLDVAGMANTGNRLVVEFERGKPTVQIQKVLDILELLGLEMVVRARTPRAD